MTDMVLVSGGSGGIGGALCARLAKFGVRPIIGYSVNSENALALAEQTNGMALALDIRDKDQVGAALDKLEAEPGNLIGLVLAASPAPTISPLFRQPAEYVEGQWAVNVSGSMNLLEGVIKRFLRPQRRGWVVGILSQAMGLDGDTAKSMGGYIIAKYGMLGLLRVIDAEYAWLKVHHISPGYTETSMLDVFDERFLQILREDRPEGRFETPDEVAAWVMALIESDLS
jgi:NAD(P)-dependent dehydrogenase (short-subunit alcohol dehydrogenase family)